MGVRLTSFANLYQKKSNAPEKFHFTVCQIKKPRCIRRGFLFISASPYLPAVVDTDSSTGTTGTTGSKGIKRRCGTSWRFNIRGHKLDPQAFHRGSMRSHWRLFRAARLFCSLPLSAVVNSGSWKITKEPLSISDRVRDSSSLAVSTLICAPLPMVVCPTYSKRFILRSRMIGSVMGLFWNPRNYRRC